MSTQSLHGRLIRLAAPDPDRDAVEMAAWSRDTEMLRLMDDDPARPWSPSLLQERMSQEPTLDHFWFMVRRLEDDRLIGEAGLGGISWVHGEAWLYISLGDRSCWGKGYGTDAVRVLLRYAFEDLNLTRVSLGVYDYNPRAMRVYEKVGFVHEGRLRQIVRRDGGWHDEIVMGVLREDWERTAVA
jgi:RimJ/RimL family protein N-acetyltransferase